MISRSIEVTDQISSGFAKPALYQLRRDPVPLFGVKLTRLSDLGAQRHLRHRPFANPAPEQLAPAWRMILQDGDGASLRA
jgi:hypothetical protein